MNSPNHKLITLGIPENKEILAALGAVTIHHEQLKYILQMTVKTLANLDLKEALDATAQQGSSELRKRIKKLANQRLEEGQALLKLEALLERSRRASKKRNEFVHNLWAHELDGMPVFKNDEHKWGPIPTVSQLNLLSDELENIANDLNKARLEGFLAEALVSKSL